MSKQLTPDFETDAEIKALGDMPTEARMDASLYQGALLSALGDPKVTRDQFASLILYSLSVMWIHGRSYGKGESLKECLENCPSGKNRVATVTQMNKER